MKNYLSYLPAGLALIASGTAAASYGSGISGGLEHISTSDHFKHDSIYTQFKQQNKNGTGFGVRAEKHRFKNPNARHDAKSVYLHGSTYLGRNVRIHAGAGSMQINRLGSGVKKTFTPYHVGADVQLGSRAQVQLRQERSPAYIRHALTNKHGHILVDDTSTIELKTRPLDRLQFNVQHQRSKLSDGNRGRKTTAGVYFGLTPHIWLGAEGSQRSYDRHDPSYWTPKKARSYAAVLDASIPLSERARLTGALKAGRMKEEGYSGQARTVYASLGADFALSQNTTLSANVYRDESRRDGKKWRENGAMLNLTYKW